MSTLTDRIRDAVEKGQRSFWQTIAECFPEAKNIDLSLEANIALEKSLFSAVVEWALNNVPLGSKASVGTISSSAVQDRFLAARKAKLELSEFLCGLIQQHSLSFFETIYILCLNEQDWINHALREEWRDTSSSQRNTPK